MPKRDRKTRNDYNDGCFGWITYILLEALIWIGCSGCALPAVLVAMVALFACDRWWLHR